MAATIRTLFLIVAILASPALPEAHAQGRGDAAVCRNENFRDLDKRLAACARAIDDSRAGAADRARYHQIRGNIYSGRDDFDRAITEFTISLGINPRNDVALAGRSRAYWRKNEYDAQIADASAAIRIDPKYRAAYYLRGLGYYGKRDDDRAIADFNQSIKLDPKFEPAYYYRGRSHFRKQDFQRALADFDQSIRMDPKFAPAWNIRGQTYDRLGDEAKALENYNGAIALNPKLSSALHNRGLVKSSRGDYDGAIRDLTLAIESDPDEISHNARGVAYRNKGELELAIADFNKAIAFDPKHVMAHRNRGLLHSRAGNFEASLADLRRAVRLQPDDRDLGEALKRVEKEAAATPPAVAVAAAPVQTHQTALNAQPEPAAPRKMGKRVALVIGNSDYLHSPKLANPGNDADDIAAALRELGFDVVVGRNVSRTGMNEAIRDFGRMLDGAELAMLFYAGHGLQMNGRNYLLPVDAKVENPSDLQLDAIDVQRIIELMDVENRVNLIFLDACRDNPLSRSLARSVQGRTRSAAVAEGLAPIQSAAGTLIAYATQPDNVALDGTGRNSPFTSALLKHIAVPGLEIETMMKQVRLDVISETRNKQVPWGHSSLVGNVYLKLE